MPDRGLRSERVDRSLYPDTWLRESRAGYGYVTRVPCRVLTQTARRIKVIALKANGEPVVRYVKPENIERGQLASEAARAVLGG